MSRRSSLLALAAIAPFVAGCSSAGGGASTSAPVATPAVGSSSVSTTSQPAPSTITASQACTHFVEGLSFVNKLDGFALSSFCWPPPSTGYLLSVTTDGGSSWHVVSDFHVSKAASSVSSGSGPSNHLVFADRHFGLAYVGEEVLVTTDGGRRWRAEVASGPVAAAFSAVGRPWVVIGRCEGGACTSVVRPVLQDRLGAPRPLPDGSVEVAVVGDTWFTGPLRRGFWVSHNLGRTWQAEHFPTSCLTPPAGTLAVSPGGAVWVACGLGVGAGAEAKAIFVSLNGGLTWKKTAQAPAFSVRHPVGHLDATGYVLGLAAISTKAAILRIGYPAGDVELTRDGGVDWKMLRVPDDGGGLTFGVECLVSSCWTSGLGAVYRSTDGGQHWAKATVVH